MTLVETIKDRLKTLCKDKLVFPVADTVTVPATASKRSFVVTEVTSRGMCKIAIDGNNSFVPLSTLSDNAHTTIIAKIDGLFLKPVTNASKQTKNKKHNGRN